MQNGPGKTIQYQRSHFATQLPVDYRYSPTHAWVAQRAGDRQRIGLTKFATRMLGEMVDHGFSVAPGAAVAPGQIIGWVEGFKAIADIYCVAHGTFAGANPALNDQITLLNDDPFGAGWLYDIQGQPDPNCLDVEAYRNLLDATIDRLLAQRQGDTIQ